MILLKHVDSKFQMYLDLISLNWVGGQSHVSIEDLIDLIVQNSKKPMDVFPIVRKLEEIYDLETDLNDQNYLVFKAKS